MASPTQDQRLKTLANVAARAGDSLEDEVGTSLFPSNSDLPVDLNTSDSPYRLDLISSMQDLPITLDVAGLTVDPVETLIPAHVTSDATASLAADSSSIKKSKVRQYNLLSWTISYLSLEKK